MTEGSAAPRFAPGTGVRVRHMTPPGHLRVPRYAMGAVGRVEAFVGAFANPEELAYGRPGTPEVPLYRVAFPQAALWPDYRGDAADLLVMDIYEHWLEPAP